MSNLFWLTDAQMARLQPFFPKSHGKPRVDDRRGLSDINFINRNGLRWYYAPKQYGPPKSLLLWLPPLVQAGSYLIGRDRVRTSVRPRDAALPEAAGRDGDQRIGSKSTHRAFSSYR
jgi:transposase